MFAEQKKLPDVEYFRARVPLSAELQERKKRFDRELKENFVNRQRFVAVCGPCSADDPDAMDEYLTKLSEVSVVCKSLFVVARIYTTKPHSNGQGYKGSCFNLTTGDNEDLERGIIRCRKMMVKSIELGLPVADELLYTDLYEYFADLVSYWFVGARSSEDALHRSFASGLDVCCGVKNGTDGDISKVVDSLYAVSRPCVFPWHGSQICTIGCKTAHIVLRGGKTGDKFISNIDEQSVDYARSLLSKLNLSTFIMTDLSHANSGKIARNQLKNALTVIGNKNVGGVMVESYLFAGEKSTEYGVSQTDDCLSFDDCKALLLELQSEFTKR